MISYRKTGSPPDVASALATYCLRVALGIQSCRSWKAGPAQSAGRPVRSGAGVVVELPGHDMDSSSARVFYEAILIPARVAEEPFKAVRGGNPRRMEGGCALRGPHPIAAILDRHHRLAR